MSAPRPMDPRDRDTQLHLVDVWEEWREEEGESWRHGGVGANIGESYTRESQLGLLRYSHTVKYIHSYFSNLEARKCCLNLAGGKTTFTNMRVVQDTAGEDVAEDTVAPSVGSRDPTTDRLSAQELLLFKKAFSCTQFPVLSAPDPPPVSSPTLTPMPRPKSSTLSESFSLTSEPGAITAEMEYSMIPSELLSDWLRQVFGLTNEAVAQYESLFREANKRKSHSKILVEELVGQLSMLESNSHPYYNPSNFLGRHGYGLWQQLQRINIGDLVSKFWHFSLPTVKSSHQVQEAGQHHHHYKLLLHKLLHHEKVCSGGNLKTPRKVLGTTLTSASQRVLQEFALRYGIGELYRRICYLDYLANHFENDLEVIRHIVDVLSGILSLLPSNRARVIVVKSEHRALSSCLGLLCGQCENSLTRVKRLFTEGTAVKGVAGLIALLEKVLQLKQYIEGRKQPHLSQLLLKYVKCNFTTAYERHKIIACSDLRMSPQVVPISPKLLNRLLSNIKDEVEDYKLHYNEVFTAHFDMAREAAQSFYDLLMRDVLLQCELSRRRQTASSGIDLTMVALVYRLHGLDTDWDSYISTSQQVWRTAFEGQILDWLTTLHRHSEKLLKQAVGADDYTVIFCGSSAQPHTTETDARCDSTTSSVSLTPSANSAFSAVQATAQPPDPFLTSGSIFGPLQETSALCKSSPRESRSTKKSRQDQLLSDLLTFSDEPRWKKFSSTPNVAAAAAAQNTRPDFEKSLAQSGIAMDLQYQQVAFLDIATRMQGDTMSLPGGLDVRYFSLSGDADGDVAADVICGLHAAGPSPNGNGDPMQLSPTSTGSPRQGSSDAEVPPGGGGLSSADVSRGAEPQSGTVHDAQLPGIASAALGGDLEEDSEICDIISSGEHGATDSGDQKNGTSVEPTSHKPDGEEEAEGQKRETYKHATSEDGMDSTGIAQCAEDSGIGHLDVAEKSPHKDAVCDIQGQKIGATSDGSERPVNPGLSEKSAKDSSILPSGQELTVSASSPQQMPDQAGDLARDLASKDRPVVDWDPMECSRGDPYRTAYPPPPPENMSMSWQSASSSFRNDLLGSGSFFNGETQQNAEEVKMPAAIEHTARAAAEKQFSAGDGVEPDNSDYQVLKTETSVSAPPQFDISSVSVDTQERNFFIPKLLPISGSLLDLLCILQRLVSFSEIMCNTVFPLVLPKVCQTESEVRGQQSSKVSEGHAGMNRSAEYKAFDSFEVTGQGHSTEVKVTDDWNTDDSAVQEEMLRKRAGARLQIIKVASQLVRQAKLAHQSDKVWGCRHMLQGALKCAHYIDRRAKYLADKFEPVVQEMCVRVNNILDLLKVWQVLVKANRRVLDADHLGEIHGDSDPELRHQHCNSDCVRHLEAVRVALLKVIAHRINLFFHETLTLLLSQELSSLYIESRLAPLTEFLGNYTVSLRYWLYRDNYCVLLKELWAAMAKSFEVEALTLRKLYGNAGTQAEILLQAIAHFLKFMYRAGSDCGVTLDYLTKHVERVSYWLQLYTQSTARLTSAFTHLSNMTLEAELSASLRDLPPMSYLHSMQCQLHATRKCFTGRQMMQWLMQHSDSAGESGSESASATSTPQHDETDVEIKSTSAAKLAQKLLDSKIVIGLEDNPRGRNSSQVTTETGNSSDAIYQDPYPELLYCGTPSISYQYSGSSLPLSLSSSSSSAQSVKSLPALLRIRVDSESSRDTITGWEEDGEEERHSTVLGSHGRPSEINDSGYETVEAKTPLIVKGSEWNAGFRSPVVATAAIAVSGGADTEVTGHPGTSKDFPQTPVVPPSVSSTCTESTAAAAREKVFFQNSRHFLYRFSSITDGEEGDLEVFHRDGHSVVDGSEAESEPGDITATTSGSHMASHMTGQSHMTTGSSQLTALYTDTFREKGVSPQFLLEILCTRWRSDRQAKSFLLQLPAPVREQYKLHLPRKSPLNCGLY